MSSYRQFALLNFHAKKIVLHHLKAKIEALEQEKSKLYTRNAETAELLAKVSHDSTNCRLSARNLCAIDSAIIAIIHWRNFLFGPIE